MKPLVLFQETLGCGLRDVSRWFDVTQTPLSEWDQALGDGTLTTVMATLGLVPASPRTRRDADALVCK